MAPEPSSPLGNSRTKLSLIFGAYLYSVASNVSPQGETSSWETKKAFCDFINFTQNKRYAFLLCTLQRHGGTLIFEVAHPGDSTN